MKHLDWGFFAGVAFVLLLAVWFYLRSYRPKVFEEAGLAKLARARGWTATDGPIHHPAKPGTPVTGVTVVYGVAGTHRGRPFEIFKYVIENHRSDANNDPVPNEVVSLASLELGGDLPVGEVRPVFLDRGKVEVGGPEPSRAPKVLVHPEFVVWFAGRRGGPFWTSGPRITQFLPGSLTERKLFATLDYLCDVDDRMPVYA